MLAGGADETPFVTYIIVLLSSVASVMGYSMVSYLLDTMHYSSFDFKVFKTHVKRCGECREILQCGIELSIVERGLGRKVIQ